MERLFLSVKERVKAVLRYRKPSFWATCAAVCVCVGAAVCFLTRPVDTQASEFDADAQMSELDADAYTTEAAPYAGEALSGELESAVGAAIIEHNRPRHASGEFDAESHVLLDIVPDTVHEGGDRVPVVKVYLMSLWESFDCADGRFESVSGRSGPVALTFRVEAGKHVLSDYWEPRDGADYWTDVRDKFPSSLSDRELDTQTYILWETQEIYRQAVEHWHIDTTPILDALFDEIMSSPSLSSNPGDYLDAHPLALRELLYYDAYTSAYIDANTGTAQGLRRALMNLVSQRLRGDASDYKYASDNSAFYSLFA